jgi:hypothetical protein
VAGLQREPECARDDHGVRGALWRGSLDNLPLAPPVSVWDRFLSGVEKKGREIKLGGTVEADDTELRLSHKGRRGGLPRKARRRGGRGQPGSDSVASVLFVIARGGDSFFKVLPRPNAEQIRRAFEDVIEHGSLLITDSAKAMIKPARWLKTDHEIINVSAHGRTRGAFHLQTVNNLTAASKPSWRGSQASPRATCPTIWLGSGWQPWPMPNRREIASLPY